MNLAHVHLLLNHFPVIGTIIGLGLYLASLLRRNKDWRQPALTIFAVVALLVIPTFISGVGAGELIKGISGISRPLIDRHEGAAMLAIWFMLLTGTLALIGLWQIKEHSGQAKWNVSAVLVIALLTTGLMARTGTTGGDIRHTEVLNNPSAPTSEGVIGSVLSKFEPTPDRFTHLVVDNKWRWAFIMDLHFIGLALLIGTIGVLNLRIIGFFKGLPIAPLYKVVPWAMVGFGINVVTGLLAFIGMPVLYAFDIVFWYKMFALLLLGLNAAVFYLTGMFDSIEPLTAGEDAPISAKLIAASALFLWFSVIILGRYIQVFVDSIPGSN